MPSAGVTMIWAAWYQHTNPETIIKKNESLPKFMSLSVVTLVWLLF